MTYKERLEELYRMAVEQQDCKLGLEIARLLNELDSLAQVCITPRLG